MAALLFDCLGVAAISRGLIVASFAVLFVLIVSVALMLETNRVQGTLRGFVWYRRLELLEPTQLRDCGLVALGLGLCSFAAMLTIELIFPGTPVHAWLSPWVTLGLGLWAVVSVTLGAACLERAALLDG